MQYLTDSFSCNPIFLLERGEERYIMKTDDEVVAEREANALRKFPNHAVGLPLPTFPDASFLEHRTANSSARRSDGSIEETDKADRCGVLRRWSGRRNGWDRPLGGAPHCGNCPFCSSRPARHSQVSELIAH